MLGSKDVRGSKKSEKSGIRKFGSIRCWTKRKQKLTISEYLRVNQVFFSKLVKESCHEDKSVHKHTAKVWYKIVYHYIYGPICYNSTFWSKNLGKVEISICPSFLKLCMLWAPTYLKMFTGQLRS